jgi:hypothetical protein
MSAPRDPIYYRDQAGKWRWSVVARNGRVVDASSQGFTRKWSARRNYWLGQLRGWANG